MHTVMVNVPLTPLGALAREMLSLELGAMTGAKVTDRKKWGDYIEWLMAG